MTDDNARYRSSDPFAPTPDQGGHGNDPLAELARLIGQSDPFADLARREQPAPAPRAPQAYDDPPPLDEHYREDHADHQRAGDYHQHGDQPADHHYQSDQPAYDQPRYDAPYPADPAPQFAEPAQLAREPAPAADWRKQPSFDPFASASSRAPEPTADRYRDEAPPPRVPQ